MKYEIELINQTDYHTRAIRKILREMMRECGITELRCELYYSRQSLEMIEGSFAAVRSFGVMGWGWIQQPKIRIGLPNTFTLKGTRLRFDPQRELLNKQEAFVRVVASVVYHEIGHTLGLRHGDMSREMRHPDRNSSRFDCISDLAITRRAI